MKNKINIFWFRRDLRLSDNAGLYHALLEHINVFPIFIFDKDILKQLEEPSDRRVDFIHKAVSEIHRRLTEEKTTLTVYYGKPEEIFKQLTKDYCVENVYTNHDYEPYAKQRDESIRDLLTADGAGFKTYKDQCIFEKDEVVKDDGKPYTVFTPYSNKWKKKFNAFYHKPYPTEKYFSNFLNQSPSQIISLQELGFEPTDIQFSADPKIEDELIKKYKDQRDYPYLKGTSRLSIYLRFGVVSIRALVTKAIPLNETWLNELIWRDFYMMILWQFPHVANGAFKKEYDKIPWRHDEANFEKWCSGNTGFPIVDAGMRELNATGFMHNRVRMIVSSFLVKDLLINWQLGEAYFAKMLNDFDLSANNGGWQWAAGSGCDAAPYFRVFNPTEQQKKFDPDFKYIKQWAPEFGTAAYPAPIVDHAQARLRALSVYKNSLAESRQIALF